ncbi:MAG: hypothetical protein AUH75_05430 [Gemmatimonadetes bacterium 13_1_40CM_4_65_7]|nr:MAG: hypothetical protein AUH75_05430 [Gemmatimonadetes bacterium 13_1_40CM_4_65_7]
MASAVGPIAPWVRQGTLVLVTTVALSLTSCGSLDAGRGRLSLPSPEQSITGFDDNKIHVEYSFFALNELARSQTTELRRAALRHLGDRDPRVHYAAVYGLALTATSASGSDQLVAMLTSSNVDERLLSAASLAGIGDRRGLPVLINALDEKRALAFRRPPQYGFQFAQAELLNLTAEDYGLKTATDETGVAAAKPAWQQWWASHQATLHLDRKLQRYVA